MASSSKLISIIFLFALFSTQIHAREFFSKIPTVNNNGKETTSREQEHATETTQNSEEQEPRFIPETQNGYGLYGHGTGTNTPSFTTKETYEPYVTPVKYHPDEPYNSIPESSYNYNNKNAYESTEVTEQKNWGNARFTEKGWSTKENQNNNNNYYYNGNNVYSNDEKQGVSDTRYLENGKYYYDVKSESSYYPKQFENTRGFASRNEFNENRYNMGRYNQNQEEFEDTEEEFLP